MNKKRWLTSVMVGLMAIQGTGVGVYATETETVPSEPSVMDEINLEMGRTTTTQESNTNRTPVEVGTKIVSTGITLTPEQFVETLQYLDAMDVPEEFRTNIRGSEIDRYTGNGSTDESAVYSSVAVEFMEEDYGVNVEVLLPENITEVSPETYQNAAITAGGNNLNIKIVNVVVPVNGRGALSGIYKILENFGSAEITDESIEFAELEIDLIQGIIEREDEVEQEQVNSVVAMLKKDVIEEISMEGGIDEETMNAFLLSRLDEFGIDLTEQTKEDLLDILVNFSQTNAARNTDFLSTLNLLGGEILRQGGEVINTLDDEFVVGTTQIRNSKPSTIPTQLLLIGFGAVILASGAYYMYYKKQQAKKDRAARQRRKDAMRKKKKKRI